MNLNFLFQHTAETSMAEDYHLDQSDSKRYSVDPGDSAFSSISSSYSPKSSYGFRSSQQFSNGSAPMGMCRQTSSSPNTFLESNRTGKQPAEAKPTNNRPRNNLCQLCNQQLFDSTLSSGHHNYTPALAVKKQQHCTFYH